MISLHLILFLGAGTLAMMIQMFLRYKQYNISAWKLPFINVFLTVAGTLGTLLMFFLENGFFGGRSFFGAIFLAPLLMLPVGLAFHVPFGTLMDLCAPAECAMLAIMKVDCILQECCGGKVLFTTEAGKEIRFPSQIVEAVLVAAIMLILMRLEKNKNNRGKIYPFYLILYGGTRFIVNWFRANNSSFVWGLPAGNFWGLCAIAIGCVWFMIVHLKGKTKVTE